MTYPTAWEYAAITLLGDTVAGMNKAGADGWEFCFLIEDIKPKDGKPGGIGAMMKRPKKLIETNLDGIPPGVVARHLRG